MAYVPQMRGRVRGAVHLRDARAAAANRCVSRRRDAQLHQLRELLRAAVNNGWNYRYVIATYADHAIVEE